jgi:hypothetical protein
VPATGQLVNVLAAGAAVWLTYLLGRDLLLRAGVAPRRAHRAGALGAVLLGVTGRFVESGVLIVADSVALATSLLAAWALIHWCAKEDENDPQTGWLALSTTALAWSVITRWGQALLFVVWLAVFAPTMWVRRRCAIWWRGVVWAIVPAAIVLGAQLYLVFTVRPVANLGPIPFEGDLAHLNGGAGWSLTHLFQHRFTNEDGVQTYFWPNALYYAAGAFLLQYFTPLFFPAFIAGVTIAATTYRRLLLLLVWPVLLLFFDAGLDQQNPRYILAALPPVAIFVGLGATVLWKTLAPHWQPVGLVLIRAGLVTVAAIGLRGIGTLNRERTSDSQVASWTAASEPAGATTLSFGIMFTLQHETDLHVLDLSVLTKPALKRLVVQRRPLYLLVRVGEMHRQFAARTPGINYRFLRDNPGLQRLGALHRYTLARVNAP